MNIKEFSKLCFKSIGDQQQSIYKLYQEIFKLVDIKHYYSEFNLLQFITLPLGSLMQCQIYLAMQHKMKNKPVKSKLSVPQNVKNYFLQNLLLD